MALLLFLNLLIAQQSNAFRNDKILNRDPTRVCARVCVCVCVCVCAIYFKSAARLHVQQRHIQNPVNI